MRALPQVPIKFDSFPLRGGLDLHTPQLSLRPGYARDALNWECSINGGYTRVPGYERYDGHASPSAAVMGTLRASAVAGIAVGDAVNGQTSGATATVCYIDGTVVAYTKATGTFVVGENLRKVAVVIGSITEVGVAGLSQTQQATYQLGAYNIYRADHSAVPGSGSVRGLFMFGGTLYAWRNNAGGTAALLYRASGTGWTAITLPYEVAFTGGSGTQPAEGATITKGAVSAVVRRVVTESGTWGAGTAAGRFIVDAPTGGSFTAGALTAGATATLAANLAGGLVQAQVSFLPGGRFEHHVGNAGLGVRVYGCDGVNRGWEFDGNYVVPIKTGMASDTPSHVHVHKSHLFFSFNASAQHSSIANPYQWSVVTGAGELLINDTITGFLTLPGDSTTGALGILSDSIITILYGNSAADWKLTSLNATAGCKVRGSQVLNDAYLFDDQGVMSLTAVQSYGNFGTASITQNLRSFVQQRRTLITDSTVNYEKSQYRVFFSDGYGLFCTIVNGKFYGAMPVKFPNVVNVVCNGGSTNGGEVTYFGSTDGFVYRMDVGTSFDGATIDHTLELAFAFQGSDRVRKRYRKAVFEIQGDSYVQFNAGWTLAYGDENVVSTTLSAAVTPAYWDEFTWDQFVWDGRAIAPSYISLEGSAENIAIRFEGSSALWGTFTVNSVTLHYTPRRIMR